MVEGVVVGVVEGKTDLEIKYNGIRREEKKYIRIDIIQNIKIYIVHLLTKTILSYFFVLVLVSQHVRLNNLVKVIKVTITITLELFNKTGHCHHYFDIL